MTRKIQSINVKANKFSTTVYINFDNGRFGTHSKDTSAAKWIDSGLSADELTEAKRIALKDGKWTNWSAPRKSSTSTNFKRAEDEDELNYQYPVANSGDDSEKVTF